MSKRIAWTRDEDEKLAQMSAAGKSYDEIAAALGRSYWAVTGRARHSEVPGRKPKKRWTDEELEELREFIRKTGRSAGSIIYGLELLEGKGETS